VKNIADSPKSISRSESFNDFQTHKNYIISQLNNHIHKVCKKLRNEKLLANCIGVMLRTKDFQTYDAKINLVVSTNTEFELTNIAKNILDKLFQENAGKRNHQRIR
jgi:nucleotidyltransferase/DNA polymerase involved in DNA repair